MTFTTCPATQGWDAASPTPCWPLGIHACCNAENADRSKSPNSLGSTEFHGPAIVQSKLRPSKWLVAKLIHKCSCQSQGKHRHRLAWNLRCLASAADSEHGGNPRKDCW